MGCDIHWYSETRKEGKWSCDQKESFDQDEEDGTSLDCFPNRGRDYWFFGLLADVRTECTYRFEPKGIPDDLSFEIKAVIDSWDCDGHSHSWLTRTELKDKLKELAPKRVELLLHNPTNDSSEMLRHNIDRLMETIKNLSTDVPDTDQRIVFFFDN